MAARSIMNRTAARAPRAAALPTASGGIARAAYARAREAGLKVNGLLANAGLTHAQISRPDVRIAARSQIKFLDEVARRLDDDLLGIHLAQTVDLRELGLMYYVLASCEDLRTALMRLARYSAIANEGVVVDFRIGAEITISFEYVGVARSSDRQQIEFFMMILVRLLRHVIGRNLSPVRAHLMHQRESSAAEVGSLLGCAVEFGAATDHVVFPGDVKRAALKEADPYLNRMLLRFCDEMLSHRRVKAGDWRLKVENAIVPLLPHGEATIENVARKLGVSERTLTRRLGREHTTFLDVRRELRHRLATQYLRDPETNMTRVAWLLGYRGSSAFSHAFKSWTGRTPRQTRARDRAAHL